MVRVGVLARFEFKADRTTAIEDFFENGRLVVERQPATTRWYAFRIGPSTYGAFAVFASEEDRQRLLSSGGPKAARENADLFEGPPTFELVDVLAAREAGAGA